MSVSPGGGTTSLLSISRAENAIQNARMSSLRSPSYQRVAIRTTATTATRRANTSSSNVCHQSIIRRANPQSILSVGTPPQSFLSVGTPQALNNARPATTTGRILRRSPKPSGNAQTTTVDLASPFRVNRDGSTMLYSHRGRSSRRTTDTPALHSSTRQPQRTVSAPTATDTVRTATASAPFLASKCATPLECPEKVPDIGRRGRTGQGQRNVYDAQPATDEEAKDASLDEAFLRHVDTWLEETKDGGPSPISTEKMLRTRGDNWEEDVANDNEKEERGNYGAYEKVFIPPPAPSSRRTQFLQSPRKQPHPLTTDTYLQVVNSPPSPSRQHSHVQIPRREAKGNGNPTMAQNSPRSFQGSVGTAHTNTNTTNGTATIIPYCRRIRAKKKKTQSIQRTDRKRLPQRTPSIRVLKGDFRMSYVKEIVNDASRFRYEHRQRIGLHE